MSGAKEFELVIGSRFENLDLVDMLMQAVAGQTGLDDEAAANMALAVREAAANAVRHAGAEDERRPVRIDVRVEGADLQVVVTDEGPGFDPSQLADPLAPENLLKPSGRGVFLMRAFMDDVAFEFPAKGGTVVTMHRVLELE